MTNAAAIAHALGDAIRNGQGWLARCPAHDDRSPSLSLADSDNGRLLVKCFAGCDARAVLAALRQRELLAGGDVAYTPKTQKLPSIMQKPRAYIRQLWAVSLPASGTVVETYLAGRSITSGVPSVLRFLPRHRHAPTGTFWPVMLAAVTDPAGKLYAIHRTYLSHDGKGKAPVEPAKMTLGIVGGFALHLAKAGERLAITEGVETGLSVMQAAGIPTWAALSAGGITQLILPPLPLAREVIICADHDGNGIGQRAANVAAARWLAEGRRVRIAMPPCAGQDFNDLLQGVV